MHLLIAIMLLQNPNSILTQIGIDQKLNVRIDPSISLRDEQGRTVMLGDFFGTKPIIITPVYFECPMLCSMQLNGLVRALRVMPFTAGKEFEIITFSIDPMETPALAQSKKEHYVRDYAKSEAQAGWHFLTGEPQAIRELTDNIGFRYTYDEAIGQWAHVSTLIVLTPDGRISQYLYGIEYDPVDLKYSLIQASDGKIGSIIDHALLFCYQYDPSTGKYSLVIMRVIRLAGAGTILGLAAVVMFASRKRGK